MLVEKGAFMEECQGWERPGWFSSTKSVEALPYNYAGCCDTAESRNHEYRAILEEEYTFNFSPYSNTVRVQV